MARIARRSVLKLSASGGMAAILASGRAPALAQETSVHWLRWADFVPASDVLLKGPITQECKKATGINLKLETVNANDLQSRITSAIQSGTGADIIMALNNWPQLYAESLADVERPGRGDRQGRGRLLRYLPAGRAWSATSGSACRGPSAAD